MNQQEQHHTERHPRNARAPFTERFQQEWSALNQALGLVRAWREAKPTVYHVSVPNSPGEERYKVSWRTTPPARLSRLAEQELNIAYKGFYAPRGVDSLGTTGVFFMHIQSTKCDLGIEVKENKTVKALEANKLVARARADVEAARGLLRREIKERSLEVLTKKISRQGRPFEKEIERTIVQEVKEPFERILTHMEQRLTARKEAIEARAQEFRITLQTDAAKKVR